MAAASAGGPKSGIDPVSGTINCIPPQQSLNQHQQTLMQQHKQQQQQQHQQQQFIHQIQQQQNHQQQIHQHQSPQPLHHIQKQYQPQQYFPSKITVVPKLNDNKLVRSSGGGGGGGVQLSSETVSNTSASHQSQQLNYNNLTIKKPPQTITTKGPNVSKGWRRLIIKGDIVYLSPSGSALTSLANVKEYLLKSGTCKCGLPCPLRPEIFFDFDIEVPNRLLRLSNVENSTCSHIEKVITVQPPSQTAATTIVGRRQKIVKEWPNSQQKVSTVISSGIIPQFVNSSNVNNSNNNNSNSNIISIQKQIKSQNNNSSSSSIVNVGSNVVNSIIHNNTNNNQIQSNLSSSVVVDSKLSNLKLTRSPPWRKKTNFVAPQNQSSQQQQVVNEIIVNNNERVPPLPTQHIPPPIVNNATASQQQAPSGGSGVGTQPNIRIIKTGNSTGTATTTIRGKKNPSFKDDPTGYLDQQTAILQNSILSVPSPDIPVISEPRNVMQPNNSSLTINNNPIQIYNNNQHQVININSNGSNFINQNQHTAAFPLHNNQILVQQQNNSNDQILHHTANQIVTNIPQTTTFCGQTVTHMPNGVVQIHNQSNQSNSVPSDITLQQQLQIQQQIQQQNQLIRQTQQLQHNHNYPINDEIHVNPSHNDKLLPDSQESPVSSSTTIYSQTPDTTRITPDTIISSKGPVQGGTISTSNDSTSSSTSSSPVEQTHEINLNTSNAYRLNSFASSETTSKNTITSVLAGRTMTATTSVNPSANFNPARQQQYNQTETYDHHNIMSVANQMPDIQIQQIARDDNSNHSTSSHHSHHGQQQQQFIMTSNGQIILMSNNKGQTTQQAGGSGGNTHQMIINTNNGGSSSQQFSIDNHNIQSNVQIISQQNMIQTHKNNQFNNFNNVILSTSGNNSNSNQNLSGNMLNPQQQQTVVLNTIPSGFVIPNFVDGGQVIINQGGNSAGNFVQQQIQVSPDSKRRPKKRKNSMSPQSPSPTTIQVPQQNQSMLQISTPQYSQNFQLSPSLSGITIIPNQTHHKNPQQQIIMSHQNGQIIQPINLIGQQLLVPAGLVVAPDATLLQIQNCGPTILTQQGMMIRAPSPQNIQNKSFLSPNGQGQQYIVNSNGQVSPIGQIYSTPVGLVVPQTNAGQTFVQQNTTIVQQQTTMMNNNTNNNNSSSKSLIETQSNDNSNVGHSVSTQTAHQQQQQIASLPPDTTTHSPRSPERPASSKSIGSSDQMNMAMVQCVSSSEPDSAVSPFERRQSPAIEYNERNNTGFRNYQQTFKSTDNKIRRIESTLIVDRKKSLENIEAEN